VSFGLGISELMVATCFDAQDQMASADGEAPRITGDARDFCPD
jgi:hypothetical protein